MANYEHEIREGNSYMQTMYNLNTPSMLTIISLYDHRRKIKVFSGRRILIVSRFNIYIFQRALFSKMSLFIWFHGLAMANC